MTLPHKDWTIWTLYICNRCFWDLETNSGPDFVLYGWLCCYVQLCIALIEENRKGQVQQLVSWSCRKESSGFEPWNVQCTDAQNHQFCSLWYAPSLWQVKCLCDLIPVFCSLYKQSIFCNHRREKMLYWHSMSWVSNRIIHNRQKTKTNI